MAALVQTYPQETGTITMLQTRPTSATGRMPSGQQQTIPQYGSSAQAPRSAFHGTGNVTGYRGSSTPIPQYAFQGTPSLHQVTQWQPAAAYRATYTPDHDLNARRHRFPTQAQPAAGSRDDSALYSHSARPALATTSASSNKSTPDRYRRGQGQPGHHARSQSATLPSGTNLPNTAQFYNVAGSRGAVPNRPNSFYATVPGASVDDMHIQTQPQHDGRGMRRRSMHSLEPTSPVQTQPDHVISAADKIPRTVRSPSYNSAHSAHSRNGSSESVHSSRSAHSRPSSANRGAPVPTGVNPSSPPGDEAAPTARHDQAKPITVPARVSSSDAPKRTLNPSPLSRSGTMADDADETTSSAASPAPAGPLDSPAAKQLAAISQKGGKAKSKTSRLRRAFSFGSAAEFRNSGGADNAVDSAKAEPSRLHKEPTADEAYDAEQARIAQAQEAAGIGSSIYGGRFFSGSTDNLSISSTASSASIMIRKMGRGMKKGSRSLAGLFRPKSVVGVPPSEPVEPEGSQATVSMVTVEAETQRVNVVPKPQSSDSFPHLERNSLDVNQVPDMQHQRSNSTETESSRRSIVGGDRERAEVLAAVRKGILKRTGSSSPSVRPVDASMDLPNVPAISDSPSSSAPSTPNDEAQGHRRTSSVAIGSEDYFMTALRLRQDTRSAPGTPQGGAKRNATFSPRIVFHDTWPSQEYDRRGDIATCNRLTPMLAQQIKEELNTFKMEMEVHENSKIYTHFF